MNQLYGIIELRMASCCSEHRGSARLLAAVAAGHLSVVRRPLRSSASERPRAFRLEHMRKLRYELLRPAGKRRRHCFLFTAGSNCTQRTHMPEYTTYSECMTRKSTSIRNDYKGAESSRYHLRYSEQSACMNFGAALAS